MTKATSALALGIVATVLAVGTGPAAAAVEPDPKIYAAAAVELDPKIYAADAPTGSDPFRPQQWGLAQTRVTEAWQRSTGAGQVVAVIDSGVDASHPDLAGRVLPGYDAIARTAGGDTDPNGHGTHVAGVIAAITGNEIGISAVAPDVQILPVRVLGADGSGDMSDAAAGIIWAADHGADVINLSVAGTGRLTATTQAVAYARSKGAVVVAAAGNARANGSPVSYPAADPGVIGVAATDSADQVTDFSNAGGYVDVAAPGSAIVSTYPGGMYVRMSGTSMASPHVAAQAALIRAMRPGLSPDAVQRAIESTAVDLGPAGRDDDSGYGRIDVAAALNLLTVQQTPTAPVVEPTPAAPETTTTPPAPEMTTMPPAPETTTTPTTPPAPVTRSTPAVRISPAAATARYGATHVTRFTVTAGGQPFAGRTVKICRAPATGAFTCADATTTSTGIVASTVRATTPYRLRVMVPETATTHAATSAIVSYRVQATVTAARASATSMAVTIGGVNGQTVRVQRLDGRTWKSAKTFRATAKAKVTGLTAKRTYRIVVPNSTSYTGATSAVVKL